MKEKAEHLRDFCDDLARAIITFKVRLVNGDFNMDTIRAVNELRARGFLANVASWFPWNRTSGEFEKPQNEETLGPSKVQLDSVLIIHIGPVNGIRLPYNSSVLGITPSVVPSVVA